MLIVALSGPKGPLVSYNICENRDPLKAARNGCFLHIFIIISFLFFFLLESHCFNSDYKQNCKHFDSFGEGDS